MFPAAFQERDRDSGTVGAEWAMGDGRAGGAGAGERLAAARGGVASAKIAELEAELAKAGSGGGSGGSPAYKVAVDALRVTLAAEAP